MQESSECSTRTIAAAHPDVRSARAALRRGLKTLRIATIASRIAPKLGTAKTTDGPRARRRPTPDRIHVFPQKA